MVGSRSGSLFEHADYFGFGRTMFGGARPVAEFAINDCRGAIGVRHRKYILE
jgi:hypothetical protein